MNTARGSAHQGDGRLYDLRPVVAWLNRHGFTQDMITAARRDWEDGGDVPPQVVPFINELLHPPPMSATGHRSGPPETIEVTSAEMARRTGYSTRHVRRLCRTGKLTARRNGRDWLITTEENDG